MKSFIAQVQNIKTIDSLNFVVFKWNEISLSMVSLDLGDSVKIGTEVVLGFKPTNVSIAKSLSGILSFSNQIKSKVSSIENGELLSSVMLEAFGLFFESIITKDSALDMRLQVGDEVFALINASDVSIKEVLND